MTYHTRTFRLLPSLAATTLAMGLMCTPAIAETIYKTIDAEGNVSFSSTPPPAGVDAQEIELSPGPTPAQQRQSVNAEQQLKSESNAMYQEVEEDSSTEAEEQADEQPVSEDEEASGDDGDAVYVGGDYVDERTRDERARDRVDDVRDAVPAPEEVHRAAGRVR